MADDRTDPIEDAEVPEADQLEQERSVTDDDAPVPPEEERPPRREPERPR